MKKVCPMCEKEFELENELEGDDVKEWWDHVHSCVQDIIHTAGENMGNITIKGNAGIQSFGDVKISCRKCGKQIPDELMKKLENPDNLEVGVYCNCSESPALTDR